MVFKITNLTFYLRVLRRNGITPSRNTPKARSKRCTGKLVPITPNWFPIRLLRNSPIQLVFHWSCHPPLRNFRLFPEMLCWTCALLWELPKTLAHPLWSPCCALVSHLSSSTEPILKTPRLSVLLNCAIFHHRFSLRPPSSWQTPR